MSEIYDLKTYYPGDDIRHVHWKLSAKTGEVLLKEGSHNSSFETVLSALFQAVGPIVYS